MQAGRLRSSQVTLQSDTLTAGGMRTYFLNRFANACLASVGFPEEVSRSTTVRAANNSHSFRAPLFAIRAVIGLRHSKRAPGSKEVHCRQVWRSALQFGQQLSS